MNKKHKELKLKPLRPENKYMVEESLQDVKDFNSLSYSQQEPALALYIAELRQAWYDAVEKK